MKPRIVRFASLSRKILAPGSNVDNREFVVFHQVLEYVEESFELDSKEISSQGSDTLSTEFSDISVMDSIDLAPAGLMCLNLEPTLIPNSL